VRNSWASTWGDDGYIYLEMAENTCGVANEATIPHVKLDYSAKEVAEAAVRREAAYQLATQGAMAGATAASVDPEWEQFKAKYKKTYVSDTDEQERYKLFKDSQVRVVNLNALNGHAAFAINSHADRFPHEKHAKGHKKPAGFIPAAPVMNFTDLRSPQSIDWRLTRAVTPIKNQGACGSCWAFSATEAIESQMVLASGFKTAISLSPQQLVSCAPNTGDWVTDGCNGGWPMGAYEYLKSARGLANSFYIPYEQSLTHTTGTKPCPVGKVQRIGEDTRTGGFAQVTGYSFATPPCYQGACKNQDLRALAAALEHSPVSICLNAGVFADYKGGVVTAKACGSMAAHAVDHCVSLTGFNTKAEIPYWIVRNSWSSTWGDEGYIYLEMAENTCGLANDATIPHLKLDHSAQEAAEAAARREAAYQLATQGAPAI